MTDTFPLEDELAEALIELARARHAFYMTERAEPDGRVADHGLHKHSVRKARKRVDELEKVVADLAERIEAA